MRDGVETAGIGDARQQSRLERVAGPDRVDHLDPPTGHVDRLSAGR